VSPSSPLLPCLPLDRATKERLLNYSELNHADPGFGSGYVMVYAGTGNADGEEWWVVAGSDRADTSGGVASFLTNQPGLPEGEYGTVINIGHPHTRYWGDVDWDADRLEQGKAAQDAAFKCVESMTEAGRR
jgi:hypothetical protein